VFNVSDATDVGDRVTVVVAWVVAPPPLKVTVGTEV
jgi:hypothetical protein